MHTKIGISIFMVVAPLVACRDEAGSDDVGETAGDGDGDMGDGDGDGDMGDGDGDGDGDCTNPDADGDGHLALACDGDDCDDNDPYAYPGYTYDGWEQLSLQPFGGGGFWRNHTWLTGPDNLSDIIFTFNGSVSHIEQESENLWDGGTFVAMGSESRAAVGPAGEIHIVFAGPGPNNDAFGVYHTIAGSGTIATIEELALPSVAPFGLDIVVEPDGRIHVVYGVVYQAPPPSLKYATSTGDGNWTNETIDDNAAGFGGTVKLDSSGVPHVSYSSYDGDEIMHAIRDGAWSSEVVATGYEVAATSLAIDAQDELHMAVSITGLEDFEDELYYVRTTGGAWETPELIDADVVWWDEQGTWDYRAAIAAGPNGQIHIAYHDEGAGMLRYTTRIDSAWTERIIDQDQAGWYPQLVLADGLLHISEANRTSVDYRRYSFAPDDGVDNDCDGTVD